MPSERTPHLVSADRLSDSVVITFDNGQSAKYSAVLLYSIFTQAEEADYTNSYDEPGE